VTTLTDTRRRDSVLTALGAVAVYLLLAAGLGNLAIADGSPLIFVGLLGLNAWIVWLLTIGARLLRS